MNTWKISGISARLSEKIVGPAGPQVFIFCRQNKYSGRQKLYLRINGFSFLKDNGLSLVYVFPKKRVTYLRGQGRDQAWKFGCHWVKAGRIGDSTGCSVEPWELYFVCCIKSTYLLVRVAYYRSLSRRGTMTPFCVLNNWPTTIKFRTCEQNSKPQINYRCCLCFCYHVPYSLISRNTITFHKYFWCSRICEFHGNTLLLRENRECLDCVNYQVVLRFSLFPSSKHCILLIRWFCFHLRCLIE